MDEIGIGTIAAAMPRIRDSDESSQPAAGLSAISLRHDTSNAANQCATEYVVMIDEHGFDIAPVEKLRAHRDGVPHRAVSVMLRNRQGAVLLQQRSALKYHCAGQWANTCCGHPRPGETTQHAAERRLREELGIRCRLYATNVFRYRCAVPGGLVENELVHLYVGLHDGPANPDPTEVSATEWVTFQELQRRHDTSAATFTPWFRLYMDRLPAFVRATFGTDAAPASI